MKKYWRLIVIIGVIVASVGTFYIQSVLAGNKLPEFIVEKLQGDDKEIESLVIEGDYIGKSTTLGEGFAMDADDTVYWKEKSIFERVNGFYGLPEIEKLQKEHRNFMRGKHNYINSFFEDEDFLAYADVSYMNPNSVFNEFKFVISVLDKKTNKTTSFEQLVPNGGDFWYLDVIKVQIVDDQLKIVARNDIKESEDTKIYLYTFDMAKEELTKDEAIISISSGEDSYTNINVLRVDDVTKKDDYVVFYKTITEYNENENEDEVVEEELIAYDLETNTLKGMNHEELAEYGYSELSDGSNVYFTEVDEDGTLEVNVYHIESEKIAKNFTVDLPKSAYGQHLKVNEGKLYIVDAYKDFKNPALVTVVDLETGSILFQGEIMNKDQKNVSDKAELQIYDILFK